MLHRVNTEFTLTSVFLVVVSVEDAPGGLGIGVGSVRDEGGFWKKKHEIIFFRGCYFI